MTYNRADKFRATIILVLIFLNIVILLPSFGCALLNPIKNIFVPLDKESVVIPETPKKQLWQTIKGLTPNWLAIPVIALGAVAMFNGAAKLGMSFIIFGSVNLFMALATSRFGFWMALCGLIGSAAAVAASIFAKNKALKEVIFGTQKLKESNVWKIGKHGVNQILANEQMKSTKKIVQKIKNKAKLKGEM